MKDRVGYVKQRSREQHDDPLVDIWTTPDRHDEQNTWRALGIWDRVSDGGLHGGNRKHGKRGMTCV